MRKKKSSEVVMSESAAAAAAAAVVQNSESPTHWQNVLSAHDSPNESERNMKVHVANLPDLTQIETENAIIVGKSLKCRPVFNHHVMR